MSYFWYFLGYGFLGYLLEKLFAYAVRSPHRVRKGFLLAPVCPVYGLAMCAVLALGAESVKPFWELALLGGAAATVFHRVGAAERGGGPLSPASGRGARRARPARCDKRGAALSRHRRAVERRRSAALGRY